MFLSPNWDAWSRWLAVMLLSILVVTALGASAEDTHVAAVKPAKPAVPVVSEQQRLERRATVETLRIAIEARISVGVNRSSGRTVPAAHCRHAKGGCDKRLREFATYIVESGHRHGVDPWLMAAMAVRESGFNPFAMGSVGEAGILQLHPKNPRAKHIEFLHNESYRKRCRQHAGACQREVVDHAAKVIARTLTLCDGDLLDALGAYNTGRCGGNDRYAKRILKTRKHLLSLVGLDADTDTASSNRAS